MMGHERIGIGSPISFATMTETFFIPVNSGRVPWSAELFGNDLRDCLECVPVSLVLRRYCSASLFLAMIPRTQLRTAHISPFCPASQGAPKQGSFYSTS